ncbi:16582_t:CDS:2, partial [Funneliformis geosporum]
MCGPPANIFFIPILAGMIERLLNDYISGSMHEPLSLPLRLLNDLMQSELFFSEQSETETECIKLETEEMMPEEEILKTAVYNVNIEKIIESVKHRIVNKYHLELDSKWLTIPLAKAILGFLVKKEDAIMLNERSMTYQELSSMGIVNLILIEQTREYLIQLPYMWVCAIVKNSNDPGMTYWKFILKYDELMNWPNFEDFNTKFWALCLNVKVDLPQIKDIKLYKLPHQYPVTKTYENNQVKYANITEIRNGYIDLDLLKNENIKSRAPNQ